jgi:hypothetical protein
MSIWRNPALAASNMLHAERSSGFRLVRGCGISILRFKLYHFFAEAAVNMNRAIASILDDGACSEATEHQQ